MNKLSCQFGSDPAVTVAILPALLSSPVIRRIRRDMIRPTKRIEWSYPTSPNAERFKKPDGCYTVDLIEHEPEIRPGVALAGFDTLEQARAFADLLSEPWDRLTR